MLKKIFSNLFSNGKKCLVAQINDKIGPINRSLTYEEPLNDFLKLKDYGEIIGAGTGQEKTGEISFCDITIELYQKKLSDIVLNDIIQKLESLLAPKGSILIIEKYGKKISFGKKEGLGLYIPNSNFPKESSDGYDINFAYSEILKLMNNEPNADRSWGGKEETALYFYGDSFEEMNNAISEFIDAYPLCSKARVIKIA